MTHCPYVNKSDIREKTIRITINYIIPDIRENNKES